MPVASQAAVQNGGPQGDPAQGSTAMTVKGPVRIAYLHHSTGGNIWDGGVRESITAWNAAHGADYRISELTYPATDGGHSRLVRYVGPRFGYRLAHLLGPYYPWANYPYDYWNLWVARRGGARDRGEQSLDDLVASHDVIVFKHCYPVSGIVADEGTPSVSSPEKTLANYRLQYEALKARLHELPSKKFIVWTGPALTEASTTVEEARRAKEFSDWVKGTWDEKGDNIFVWDFYSLETQGGLYLRPEYADGSADSHPNATFSRTVAPYIARRIIDVIEGRGDSGSLTGH